jgi:hypothetical protein
MAEQQQPLQSSTIHTPRASRSDEKKEERTHGCRNEARFKAFFLRYAFKPATGQASLCIKICFLYPFVMHLLTHISIHIRRFNIPFLAPSIHTLPPKSFVTIVLQEML